MSCPRLPSYIRNLDAESTLAYSQEIDAQHSTFLAALFPDKKQQRASFETIYSCHRNEKYGTAYKCPFTNVESNSLKDLFQTSTHPFMRSVVECFPRENKMNVHLLNKLIRDERYTCFVVAEGRIDSASERTPAHQIGFVLTKREGHLVAAHRTHQPTLFTQDTLRFLQDEKNFVIEKLYHVFVTGASKTFQPLFKQICDARMQQAVNGMYAEAALSKFFACTFIGLSQSFSSKRVYVTVRNGEKAIAHCSKLSKYEFKPIWDTKWIVVLRKTPFKPKSFCQAIGMGAIFYAKSKLLQSLLFIERMCKADSFRLMNVNTDSITLALAQRTLRECVEDADLSYYDSNVDRFIRNPAEPGFLKLESCHEGEWLAQFHGARTCKITLENVQERKTMESNSFPLHLEPFRHVYCSYVYNRRLLYWTLPFGADV